MSSAPTEPAAGKPEKPKTKLEKIISSTPVALTVVATILAGLSASEMNLAQYHRSLAAQHQSKASDEWNFFQAKKLRSQSMEAQAVLLRASSDAGMVDEKSFGLSIDRLLSELALAEKNAKQLGEILDRLRKSPNEGGYSNQCETVVRTLAKLYGEGKKIQVAVSGIKVNTLPEPLAAAFELLSASDKKHQLPAVTDRKLTEGMADLAQSERIENAYADIVARKTEEDTKDEISRISDENIKIAYTNALWNSRNFEDECDKYKARIQSLDQMAEDQLRIAGEFERAWQDFVRGLPESITQDDNWKEARSVIGLVTQFQKAAVNSARQLYRDFKAAMDLYTARRYDKEANYNRATATAAEIQVRKSSFLSDRYRSRSKLFFYAMLLAQAGVTISTLLIAIKRGSLLWGMASLAGLLAISFGAYVYMQM